MSATISGERWQVLPYVGVESTSFRLVFGVSRSQVATRLGIPFAFAKSSGVTSDTDAFLHLGLHLYYDESERLECIELMKPALVAYGDILLIAAPIEDLLHRLAEISLRHRFDDGYFFDDAGFVLHAPMDAVEAVTVYRRGYYD